MLMLAVPFIMAMLIIDLEHMILPDQLQIIVFIFGLIFIYFQIEGGLSLGNTLELYGAALASSAAFFLLAFALAKGGQFFLKREALGMGDVKFFAVAGLWLGLLALPAFLCLAGLAGVLLGAGWRFVVKQELFPFGPALILTFFLLILLRGPLISPTLAPFLERVPGLS